MNSLNTLNPNPEIKLPDYSTILKTIGIELKNRQNDIFKRIFMVSWPILISTALIFWWMSFMNDKQHIPEWWSATGVAIGIFFGLSIIYYLVMSLIFYIEKLIWIDSFFDGKNIKSSDSWRVARKLFFPVLGFSLSVLIRYVLLPLFLYGSVVFIVQLYLSPSTSSENFSYIQSSRPEIILFSVLGTIIILAIYFFYLSFKLRFIWFVFIDRYGLDNFSYSSVFLDMNALNKVRRGEMFKKVLVTDLGTGSVDLLSRNVGLILQGNSVYLFGKTGKIIGAPLRFLAQEVGRQVASFSKIISFYLLYRYARFVKYGKAQEVNDYIYKL